MHLEYQIGAGRYLARKPPGDHSPLLARSVTHQQPLLGAFLSKDDNMMDDGPVAWTDLGRLNPLVFFEIRRYREVLVFDHAAGGHFILLRQVEHLIGLADVPPFKKRGRG